MQASKKMILAVGLFLLLLPSCSPIKAESAASALAAATNKLPPGHVQGDVVSYSYVPIRHFPPKEGIGIMPYLMEYLMMRWSNDQPLDVYHDENIRRIDIVSQWSTAIMLYARKNEWRDEIINLMLRGYRNRQLIVIRDYYQLRPKKGEDTVGPQFQNLRDILDKLWENRDRELVSPEGDRATGRQLINNILACKLGDEGECTLKTEGMERMINEYNERIRLREIDGEQPFRHIKSWYNMFGFAAFDFRTCLAANATEVEKYKRFILPKNTQAIGVDVYHYWFINRSPFDPADLSIPREKVRAHSDEWQRLHTKYYPAGLRARVCDGKASHQANWIPECFNDTHALLQAIELAGAQDAEMWYIPFCGQLVGNKDIVTYTTPIETMDSYYDHLKAGPWVAMCWWYFDPQSPDGQGGMHYYDKTLVHCTKEHPEGIPYSPEMLDYWHREYVAHKMRMFNDVVYNQFGHLNGPKPKSP